METRRVALVLTLVTLAYIVLGFNRGLSIYDEAIPVVAAMRILDGDRPYRDFWVIYPPGQLYLLAALFKVFGALLIVARLASVTAVFATSILTYGMARQLRLPVSLALLAAGLWTAAVGAIAGATLGAGILTALALGLASAAFLLRFRQEPRLTWLVMSGFALGVACLFRHDIGALLLLAEAVFIAGIMANRTHRDVDHVLRSLGLYLAAVSGPGVVAATLLLTYGVPAGDLVDALVIYPFTGYVAGRSLPLPPLIPDIGPLQAGGISIAQYAAGLRTGLRFYFPVVVLALVTAVLAIRRRALPAGDVWPVAFVTLIGLCLLPYAWVNSDLAHIVPSWAPALLLFAWLLHQLPERGASRATGLALGVVWSVVFVWGALGAKTDALIGTFLGASGLPLDPPRGAHIVAGPDAAPMQAAIRYVQSVVPPGERIFVGNARHDSLLLNDVMFYFLADRRSGTRYHELVPGVATTVAVQTRIVRDLEVHRVRYLVLRADPGYVPSIGGARTLDEFIQQRFARIETFGNYGVWRRREDRP